MAKSKKQKPYLERANKAQEEVNKILEKYNLKLEIIHQIVFAENPKK